MTLSMFFHHPLRALVLLVIFSAIIYFSLNFQLSLSMVHNARRNFKRKEYGCTFADCNRTFCTSAGRSSHVTRVHLHRSNQAGHYSYLSQLPSPPRAPGHFQDPHSPLRRSATSPDFDFPGMGFDDSPPSQAPLPSLSPPQNHWHPLHTIETHPLLNGDKF